jgi:hypothetical protein
MRHSRKDCLIEDAIDGVTYLAGCFSAKQGPYSWKDLRRGLCFVADSLEACWNTIANAPDDDSYSSYPQAAYRVGLANKTRAGWKLKPIYILKDQYLQATRVARNSRHGFFDDNIPEDFVIRTIGCLLVDFERATGQCLELKVPQKAWQEIINRPRATTIIAEFIQKKLAPTRNLAGQEFINCPQCGQATFDSGRSHCRICFYKDATVLCARHGKATLLRGAKLCLLTPENREAKLVCLLCFNFLARSRELDLSRKMNVIECRKCKKRCFDLNSTRCLHCGVEDKTWGHTEIKRLGLARCQDCSKIFYPDCSTSGSLCLSCDTDLPLSGELDFWDNFEEEEPQCLNCGTYISSCNNQGDRQFCVNCEAAIDYCETTREVARILASEMVDAISRHRRVRGRSRRIRFISDDIVSAISLERRLSYSSLTPATHSG